MKLLVIDLVAALIFGGLISLAGKAGWLDADNHAVADALSEFSPVLLFLLAVIIVPLFEELIFRLPLRYETNPVAGVARLVTPTTSTPHDEELAADRRAIWDRYYPWIFYGLTTAFALIHLTNYSEWTLGVLLLTPLLVAPQFVMGAFAGYLRVRYGFGWAYALHALHNLALLGPVLLFPDLLEEATTETTGFLVTLLTFAA